MSDAVLASRPPADIAYLRDVIGPASGGDIVGALGGDPTVDAGTWSYMLRMMRENWAWYPKELVVFASDWIVLARGGIVTCAMNNNAGTTATFNLGTFPSAWAWARAWKGGNPIFAAPITISAAGRTLTYTNWESMVSDGWPTEFALFKFAIYPDPLTTSFLGYMDMPTPQVEYTARVVRDTEYTIVRVNGATDVDAQAWAKTKYYEALNRMTGGDFHETTKGEKLLTQYGTYAMALVAIPIVASAATGMVSGVTGAVSGGGVSATTSAAITTAVTGAEAKGVQALETQVKTVAATTGAIVNAEGAGAVLIPAPTGFLTDTGSPLTSIPVTKTPGISLAGFGGMTGILGTASALLLIFMMAGTKGKHPVNAPARRHR